MEYLKSITDNPVSISSDKINYLNIFDMYDIVYGCPFGSVTRDFRKFSLDVDKECSEYDEITKHEYQQMAKSASGCFLRFKTKSKRIIFKAELRRKYDLGKMTLWCSSGFDIYEVIDNLFYHKTVFAPKTGMNIFAEQIIWNNVNSEICVYLPLYNKIVNLYIGTEEAIEKSDSVNRLPILFFGNSITQGASASRSGNSFANIVSRMLNNEVYNLSCSSNCKGQISVADEIGRMNLRCIVIDYQRNAYSLNDLKKTYMPFYERVRMWHKNTPIILMTSSEFKKQIGYSGFDEVIIQVFEDAKTKQHNTYLLNQKALFDESEYDLISLDGSHYTDMGMFRVAEALTEIIASVS